MDTLIIQRNPSDKHEGAGLVQLQKAKQKKHHGSHAPQKAKPKSVRKPWYRFYIVYKNETSVTEVLTNDFKPCQETRQKAKAACACHALLSPAFALPDDSHMFYGFLSRVKAMENAKSGALKYIAKLIAEGEKSHELLLKYREDHYDDLNIHLTDRNIRRIEWELEGK